MIIFSFYFFSLFLSHESFVMAEDFFTETQVGSETVTIEDLATEAVQKISASKKILIVSNENKSFGKGDFITLFKKGLPFARSLAAKLTPNAAGIKIIKIYNLEVWNSIVLGDRIQILRGDDSSFRNKTENVEEQLIIKEEEDLFNATQLEEDIDLDQNGARAIKTDNVMSLVYGTIAGLNNDGSSASYNQFNFSWDFQLEDNIWANVSYGENLVFDYPTLGLDTKVTNLTIKIKYTIPAPLFSFVMPYVGYQIMSAASPGAGKLDPTCVTTTCPKQTDLDLEVLKVDDLKKNSVVFGINILKRLVPAWFVKLTVGTDIVAAGMALEF